MGQAGDGEGNTDEDGAGGFPWSNEMLQWQRAGFHYQPEGHFMSGTQIAARLMFSGVCGLVQPETH
jgi:hypothetical protein